VLLAGLLLVVALAPLGGCSMFGGGETRPLDEPPQVDEEALRREAEEKRLEEERRLAEEKRLEEERRLAEEKRIEAEIREVFGPVPPAPVLPGPLGVAAATPEGEVAFDQAVPPLPDEPALRVAVLSDLEQPDKGHNVALIIGTYQRDYLESQLGMAVKIAYVSRTGSNVTTQSRIHFRPDFLQAAMTVASVLDRDQSVAPMTPAELSQQEVDLMVYIGKDYR
jgi:hypothetical protein